MKMFCFKFDQSETSLPEVTFPLDFGRLLARKKVIVPGVQARTFARGTVPKMARFTHSLIAWMINELGMLKLFVLGVCWYICSRAVAIFI